MFTRHPYGLPVIGWADDIAGLGRTDALDYYQRFYTPENAILIVAGDVEPEEVVALAGEVYGAIPARGEAPKRWRVREPQPHAHRLVTLADEKVEQPSYQTCFLVPSYKTCAGARPTRWKCWRIISAAVRRASVQEARRRKEARRLGWGLLRRHGARRDALLHLRHAGARRFA